MKNHLIDEIWKDITGYEGLYQVSNLGKVKSLNKSIIRNNGRRQTFKEKTLKKGLSSNGYYSVSLTKNGKGKTFNIHKLVATAFIENKNNDKCINHIDGNKRNNNVTNLEWCSYGHNEKEAYKLRLKKPSNEGKKGALNPSSKKVYQYKNGLLIKVWDSLTSTGESGEYNYRCVGNCCLGKQKEYKGYKWKYKD